MLHLFDQKYNSNGNIVKMYYNFKLFSTLIYFKMLIISVMTQLNFQHHYNFFTIIKQQKQSW